MNHNHVFYGKPVPWGELNGAYGKTSILRDIIDGIFYDDKEIQDEAVYNGLWSWSYHQGTTYSVTPFVAEYVVQIIDKINCHIEEFFCFLRKCSEYGYLNSLITDKERKILSKKQIILPDYDVIIGNGLEKFKKLLITFPENADLQYLINKYESQFSEKN